MNFMGFKKSLLNPVTWTFSVFFKKFFSLYFKFRFVIHFELILIVRGVRWVKVYFNFLACGCLIVLALFVEETIFSPLNCIFTFVKNQLTVYKYTYAYVCVCIYIYTHIYGSISGHSILFYSSIDSFANVMLNWLM